MPTTVRTELSRRGFLAAVGALALTRPARAVDAIPELQAALREDREKQKETTIALRGQMTPAFAKQRIRVDLHDPVGALRVAETKTDSSGAFAVTFDLRYEPSLEADRKAWRRVKAILNGTYRAQARVVAGDKAATEKVRNALAADSVLSQRKITVNTLEGRVLLTGNVEAQREAEKAVELAKNVEEVRSVQDDLTGYLSP